MPYDDTEFLDRDFPPAPAPSSGHPSRTGSTSRAPTREELDAQVTANQQQLAKLREAQEQLERARAELEEMRRRRTEFQLGRSELRDQLARGIGLLEKAAFDAKRDADQLDRSLAGLRIASGQLEELKEETWTDSNWNHELSKALAVIDTARLEYQSARQKWPILDGAMPEPASAKATSNSLPIPQLPLVQLLRLGFALTWPVALVGLVAVVVFAMALNRR